MAATSSPNRSRISASVAPPPASSAASWSSAPIASRSLPPPSRTIDATASRCERYGICVPLRSWPACSSRASSTAALNWVESASATLEGEQHAPDPAIHPSARGALALGDGVLEVRVVDLAGHHAQRERPLPAFDAGAPRVVGVRVVPGTQVGKELAQMVEVRADPCAHQEERRIVAVDDDAEEA